MSTDPNQDYPQYYQKRVQTALQNAAGVVLVEYKDSKHGDVEYAIVADYFQYWHSPFFDVNNIDAKQMGGKLGIIRDPFNKNGLMKFLGSTTPIQWGMIESLQIGDNGLLYANAIVDPDFPYSGLNTALMVWDANALIQVAEDADKRGQKRTVPIDRIAGMVYSNGKEIPTPIKEATPILIEGDQENLMKSWVFNLGTYKTPDRIVKLNQVNINYSIYSINPVQAATQQGQTPPEAPRVPDNYYTRALGITDQQVADDIANGKTSGWSAAKYAGKVFLYNGWNMMTGGFVGNQADLIEKKDSGVITETEYLQATGSSAFFTLAGVFGGGALGGKLGDLVLKKTGSSLGSIVTDAVVSNAAYQVSMIGNDLLSYHVLTDGKVGKTLKDDKKSSENKDQDVLSANSVFTQLRGDVITDTGMGLIFGMVGSRIPGANSKLMWTAPSIKNPIPIKLVEPTLQIDSKKLRNSTADTTGGSILSDAGGVIVIQHQNVNTPPIRVTVPQRAVADSAESIDDALNLMDNFGKKIKDYVDPSLSKAEQAFQAVRLQADMIRATQNSFNNGNVQAAFGRFLPTKSMEQFTQEGIAKGLSGDALWNDVVASAGKYTSTSAFGCFAAGTLVHTEQGLVPIQDIKVGDRVLAKPESGEGEVSYKSVLKTFEHKDKELWLVSVEKHSRNKDIKGNRLDRNMFYETVDSSQFIATPNHPVWVVGMGKMGQGLLEEIIAYPQPHWKRVDQLQQYEVVVNKDNVMYYIDQAQPLHYIKTSCAPEIQANHNVHVELKDNCAWYQDDYYITEDEEDYEDYDLNAGTVIDLDVYHTSSSTLGGRLKNINGIITHYNLSLDENRQYIPYTETVYNLEVAEDHTYFVTEAGIWVHNTNCDKAREMLVGALEGDFAKIKTSKNSFSDDITKAINEGKSIEEIKQVAFTHGETITPDTFLTLREKNGSPVSQAFDVKTLREQNVLKSAKDMADANGHLIGVVDENGQPIPFRDFILDSRVQALLASQGHLQTLAELITLMDNTTPHSCFAAGTLVHTARGLVPIEQLQVGDQVLSKAADGTGELLYKPIRKTIITENVPIFLMEFDYHIDPELPVIDQINLRIDLDDSKLPSPLLVSANHPFWTSTKGWVTAAQLSTQDPMLTHDAKQFVSYGGGAMMVNTKRLSLS